MLPLTRFELKSIITTSSGLKYPKAEPDAEIIMFFPSLTLMFPEVPGVRFFFPNLREYLTIDNRFLNSYKFMIFIIPKFRIKWYNVKAGIRVWFQRHT